MNAPKTISSTNLIGQDRAVRLLNSLLTLHRYPPLLFTGPSGVGKRTAALLFAQAANCAGAGTDPCGTCWTCQTIGRLRHPDIRLFFPARRPRQKPESPEEEVAAAARESECYALSEIRPEMDPSLVIPIETVRWIRGQIARPPMLAQLRVFILLQAHRLTVEAANALLKTVEELPETTTVILTSDVPAEIPHTIRSRCQTVRFGSLRPELIADELRRRCPDLDIRRGASPTAAIAFSSGSLGEALRLFLGADEDSTHGARNVNSVPEEAARLLGSRGKPASFSLLSQESRYTAAELARAALALCSLGLRNVVSGRGKTGIDSCWRTEGRSLQEICRMMWFLLDMIRESETNLHPPLAGHELAAGLQADDRRT